ncbi:54S ribosomal protein L32, mitochondrial [Wickerhamiella sorbophila]|uniref:Large ribosomal subunit protein bL32m n=1 Tax=Wickerhamiella sorbophila TaxID=45607 RepID=A0A2T0FK75_9ASCO|nr:54S ribosomal protein L32, mitochondrial [Wickerhamiella sorbophila]PRT55390.1 54S ribosomal protein L32, mitochondrial [Wickerhamiella sorbophila]
MFRSVLTRSVLGEALAAPIGASLTGAGSLGLPRISLRWPWSRDVEDTSVLEAVPKKRTSHRKKRQRQLAGNNQQKPLKNLGRCPACGHFKRAHTLCMNCAEEIRQVWKLRDKQAAEAKLDPTKQYDDSGASPEDVALNFPARHSRPSEYQEKLADKEEYVLGRPKTLAVPEKPRKAKQVPLKQRKPYEN